MSDNTHHYFLPSVRHGLSTSLVSATESQRRAALNVGLSVGVRAAGGAVSTQPLAAPTVQLLGPGDILGFDARVVVRTSPQSDVGNFEPNYFPHIEFSDADFPWRFTASNTHSAGSLMPWITLVVLIADAGEGDPEFTMLQAGDRPKALAPRIQVTDVSALPDLQHVRRWAHVHITGPGGDQALDKGALMQILREHPERAVSRLLCTRRLRPKLKYSAFVVPTFELGRKAGLGQPFADADHALTLAWDRSKSGPVELPYYYSWEFRTGLLGDFERLVRQLEPRKLTDLGKRKVSCASPAFGQPPITRLELAEDDPDRHVLEVEGGLEALDTRHTTWGRDLELCFPEPAGFDEIKVARVAVDAIEISWRTANAARPKVEYGLVPDALDRACPNNDSEPACVHRVQVEGLHLGQLYYVRVVAQYDAAPATVTEVRSFKLSPQDPFQASLASLLNKPSTEDRLPADLAFSVNHDASLVDLRATALTTGDRVELAFQWRAPAPDKVRVEYRRNGKVQMAEAEGQRLVLDKLIPGKQYTYAVSVPRTPAAYEQVATGDFTMPPLPMVLPPVYGRWHRGELRAQGSILDPNKQREWLEAMNLDPRHRMAAGLGAEVVRDAQEPLMAAAWEQLGAVRQVNDTLRAGQLARDVATPLHRRLSALAPETFLRVTARAQRRVLRDSGDSGPVTLVHYMQEKTLVPRAALDAGFRRIAGPRHSIFKRQEREHSPALTRTRSVGVALAKGALAGAGQAQQMLGAPQLESVNQRFLSSLGVHHAMQMRSRLGTVAQSQLFGFIGKQIGGALVSSKFLNGSPFSSIKSGARMAHEESFKDSTTTVLDDWLQRNGKTPVETLPAFVNDVKTELAPALDPQRTVTDQMRSQVTRAAQLASRFAPDAIGDPLDPVMWAPEFWQPMYEALRDKSHAALLPGVEKVPNDTIGLLRTNRRFVEAYLAGCNHAFAGELPWRGFPTDQRGSYFRQFWDIDAYVLRASERTQILSRWLADRDASSIAGLSLADKQQLFGRDLDAATDTLVSTLLEREGVASEAELPGTIRRALIALRNDQLNALEMPELAGAVDQVAEPLAVRAALRENLADIKPLTQWFDGALGSNSDRPSERMVLVIRSDLLKRYPGTVIYAVDAVPKRCTSGPRAPALKEYLDGAANGIDSFLSDHRPTFPIFRADLPPDLTLLGFPFDAETARGDGGEQRGKYFVIEERVSEPRFGLDSPTDPPPALSGPDVNLPRPA